MRARIVKNLRKAVFFGALVLVSQTTFGQDLLPNSMIKISGSAFLTQKVRSSNKANVNSFPFIGGGLELSYYHRLPYHFGVNVGVGMQMQPSVIDNTESSGVWDIYTLYTPMVCLPFSIEKVFRAVRTKHSFLLVGELGGRLYKTYGSAAYAYTMIYGIDENGICLPDGYIVDLIVDDDLSMACFAKIDM